MHAELPTDAGYIPSLFALREISTATDAAIPRDARVYVAGHTGLVGSAILRRLEAGGFSQILVRTRRELDLRDSRAVAAFFREEQPAYVFVAAAKVG